MNTNIYRCINKLKSVLKNKKGTAMKRTVERRVAQQKRELSLAVVLSFTVLMFLITHLPRVMTSIYEAVTIRSVIQCHKRKRGYLRIWYLYALSTIQFLQVLNSSLNLPIYYYVGSSFKIALKKYFRFENCQRTQTTTTTTLRRESGSQLEKNRLEIPLADQDKESTKVPGTVGSLSNRITNEKGNFSSIVEAQGNSNTEQSSQNEAEISLDV